MDNQHKKIAGYRSLNQVEIDTINLIKAIEAELIGNINQLLTDGVEGVTVDKRSLSIAKTDLQTGFMWAIRSIAKPDEVPTKTMEEKGE